MTAPGFQMWLPSRRTVAIALFVVTVAYLIAELAFNAWVLEVASQGVAVETMERLAHTGRLLAAVGAALIVLKLFGGMIVRRVGSDWCMPLLGALALMTGVATYHGEKYLIERAVDATAPDQRLAAQYAALARVGVLAGDVEIGDIPPPGVDADPADQSFHVILGVLLLATPDVVVDVRGETQTLLTRLAEAAGDIDPDARYREYRAAMEELRDGFERYRAAGDRLNEVEANLERHARDEWARINRKLREEQWGEYEAAVADFHAEIRQTAAAIAPELQELWAEHKVCLLPVAAFERRCRRVERAYDRAAADKLADSPLEEAPPMDYWCDIPDAGFLGLARSRLERADQAECAESTDEVAAYLEPLVSDDFQDESGYPADLTRAEFLRHEKTVADLRLRLIQEGVLITAEWTPDDEQAVIEGLKPVVREHARREYREALRRHLGQPIRRDLSWSAFFDHHVIRDLIRERVGAEVESKIEWDMTRREFHEAVVAPEAREELRQRAEAFERAVLEDPDAARDAVYLALVPPIALAVSLFFGLLNAGHLLITASATLARGRRGMAWSIRIVGWLALGASLLLVPFFVLDRQYTNADAVDAMTVRLDDQLAPGTGTALRWVLRTQPHVEPVGSALLRQCRAVRMCAPAPTHDAGDVDFAIETGARARGEIAPATRRWAQEQLQALELYDGAIDGEIGPTTRAAIRAFRDDEEDLAAGDELDGAVLLYLGSRAR